MSSHHKCSGNSIPFVIARRTAAACFVAALQAKFSSCHSLRKVYLGKCTYAHTVAATAAVWPRRGRRGRGRGAAATAAAAAPLPKKLAPRGPSLKKISNFFTFWTFRTFLHVFEHF